MARITIALALALLFGCSSGGGDFTPLVCSAGKTQACVCDDGNVGAQVCAKDGSKWGACSCAATDGSGGSGAMGGTGGTSGSGGAPTMKECSTDEDCITTAKPYCVDWTCVAPSTARQGDPCGHAIICEAGSYCDIGADGMNANPNCLVTKPSGKSCYANDQCVSGVCDASTCT